MNGGELSHCVDETCADSMFCLVFYKFQYGVLACLYSLFSPRNVHHLKPVTHHFAFEISLAFQFPGARKSFETPSRYCVDILRQTSQDFLWKATNTFFIREVRVVDRDGIEIERRQ